MAGHAFVRPVGQMISPVQESMDRHPSLPRAVCNNWMPGGMSRGDIRRTSEACLFVQALRRVIRVVPRSKRVSRPGRLHGGEYQTDKAPVG